MQGAQAESDSAVSLMKTFWVCKLRLATLQAIGVPKAVLTSDSDIDWRAVERKLEEHRQFRPIDQLINVEHTREAALLDARLAEAGLKALKGLYEEALGICEELLMDDDNCFGPSSVTQKIRALGVKGLVLAQKDEWEAAKNFLLRSVVLGQEQSGSCGNFFHDYVVDLFGEALGFLLTHVVVATNTDGTHRLKQVGIPGNCQNNHAYYPFLLLGLGVLGGEGAQCRNRGLSVDQSRMYLECARLVSPWPEATCVCFNAYGMATMAAIESKNMDNVRTTMAESIQLAESLGTVHVLTILFQSLLLADSLDLATEPRGCMTHLVSSLFKRLGDMEFDNGHFYRALQYYSRALRSQLRVREMVGDSEIQSTCEQIRKSIPRGVAENDINNVHANDFARKWFSGPPADAHPVDVMVHSFCVLARIVYCYESERIPAYQTVADVISEAQLRDDVVQDAVWVEFCLERVLVEEYVRSKAYDKAAEVCVIRSRLKTDLEERLVKLFSAGKYWSMAGQLGKGIEVFRELMDESAGLVDFQWKTKARIYLSAATLLYRDGQRDNAIAAREKAWYLCTRVGSYEYSDEDIAKGMTHLLNNYVHQKNWSQACKLVDSVDAHIYKHLERTTTWEDWQSWKYILARHRARGSGGKMDFQLQDIMAPLIPIEISPEEDQTPLLPRVQNSDLGVTEGRAVKIQLLKRMTLIQGHLRTGTKRKRWAAIKLLDEILELLQKLPPSVGHPNSIRNYFVRSNIFRSLGEETRAHEEFEKAIAFFKVVEEHGDLRSKDVVDILCFQAVVAVKRGDIEESERLIVLLAESKIPASRDTLHHPLFHYHRACVLELQGLWKEAAAKAREAALLGMDEQRRTCHLDHEPVSWLHFYGFEGLMDIFYFLENLYTLNLKTPQIGLLWVERSRLRFLMHQIHSQPTESAIPSPSHFDACDQLLLSVIEHTMRALPSKTAIIEYSYNPTAQVIYMYVITRTLPNDQFLIAFKLCVLGHWFKDAGLPYNSSLEGLIEDVIGEEDPEGNMNALRILHSLLVGFIEDELEGCDSLIFSPSHGCLAKIPFVALYDNTHKEHLIVRRSVSTIPSIVMLYRCLYNQYKFETNLEILSPLLQVPSLEPESSHGLDQAHEFDDQFTRKVAFIAGNPVPMGLGFNQLPGAEKEAKDVAKLFRIKPCVGTDMTKQAVLEGLSSSKVVLLATHGKVDDDYPHGCLVLQAAPGPGKVAPDLKGKGLAQEQERDIQQQDDQEDNMRDWRVFEFADKYSKQKRAEEAPQILTAREIAALEGGISAGLVVLSACESGLGESTSGEGLLGLGRALLQAGAITAILTLWKVNDTFTCDFVTKLFKELLSVESEGKSVSECLRTVMLFMIRHNHPVKHWAPFTMMGSPILQLLKPDKSLRVSAGLHECSTPISMHLGYFQNFDIIALYR